MPRVGRNLPAEQTAINNGAGVSTTSDGRQLVQGTGEYEDYMAAIKATKPGSGDTSAAFKKLEAQAKAKRMYPNSRHN